METFFSQLHTQTIIVWVCKYYKTIYLLNVGYKFLWVVVTV